MFLREVLKSANVINPGKIQKWTKHQNQIIFLKKIILITLMAHEWKSEDDLKKLALLFHLGVPGIKHRSLGLGSKDIYPLTHLDSSQIFFVIYFTSDLKIYFKDGQKFSILYRQEHKWENIMLWSPYQQTGDHSKDPPPKRFPK